MKRFLTVFAALLTISLISGPATIAQQENRQRDEQRRAPDNTGINQRDRDGTKPTADQQEMNPSDRELSRKIREAVTDDKSLSTYAHNVKIVSQNGKVTLRGPVRSEEEKRNIAAKAAAAAGQTNVTNELEIAPPSSR